MFDVSASRSVYVFSAVHNTASSAASPLIETLRRTPALSGLMAQRRAKEGAAGRAREPARVGEELLQHFLVELEELERGVGVAGREVERGDAHGGDPSDWRQYQIAPCEF